ncbi:MAG: glycosyltransferase family 39 protein [Candidatus Heimdallarchaeota archaeon]|nr:MAG: glycosyltransferase family 39 protein [Candidatus Heimdallarchaeota archaeon]
MSSSSVQNFDDQESKTDNEIIEPSEKSHIKLFEKLYNILFKKYPILIILIIGIILRIIAFTRMQILKDGAVYSDIALGILKHGTFISAENNVPTWGESLVYPPYLAFFYKFLGFSVLSTQLASLIAGIMAILVVYLITANIFDKRKGLITAAIIAFTPWMIIATAANLTGNFVVIFLSLTLWAIIKSSENTKYLAVAGVFATLTFLTKTNIGLKFIVVGLVFFVIWQVYYHKKKILKDPYMIFFIAIILMSAFIRQYLVELRPDPLSEDQYVTYLFTSQGLVQLVIQLPLHLLLPATYFLFFIPETYRGISEWRNRNNNLLIFVLLGGTGILLIHAVARTLMRGATPSFGLMMSALPDASERYFTAFIVPTVWLFLGYLKPYNKNQLSKKCNRTGIFRRFTEFGRFLIKRKKICFLFALLIGGLILILVDLWWGVVLCIGSFSIFFLRNVQWRVALIVIAFLIASFGSVIDSTQSMSYYIMDDMHNYIREGDTIAIDNVSNFLPMAANLYFSDIEDVDFVEYDPQLPQSKYIITQENKTYENYTLFKIYNDTFPPNLRAQIYTELRRTTIDKDFVWEDDPPINVWLRN